MSCRCGYRRARRKCPAREMAERGEGNYADEPFASGAGVAGYGPERREQMEADERQTHAPYAQDSGGSRGRKFPELRHEYRTESQARPGTA